MVHRQGGGHGGKGEEEEEEDEEEDKAGFPVQLLFMTSDDSLFPWVSPDEYMIWIPLGDDFWGRFRFLSFLGSTVDTVHASVSGGFFGWTILGHSHETLLGSSLFGVCVVRGVQDSSHLV